MIIALELLMWSVFHIKLHRAFVCLNKNVIMSSFAIIHNHILSRRKKIKKHLLNNLSSDVQISLALNCWSFFNRQDYMTINAYFIDLKWKYHEVLLFFKHVKENHNDEKLITVLNNVLKTHEISNHILIIITDNVNNNETLHNNLIEMIKQLRLNLIFNASNIASQKISCLAHVI